MAWKKSEFWLAIFLVIYLLVVGLGATALVIVNFPTEQNDVITFPQKAGTDAGAETGQVVEQAGPTFYPFGTLASIDQGLLLLALLAGVAGSFLHAAQSLSSYVGNRTFKASWTTWYFLRPWIGGLLAFALYFAIRAGLVAGTGGVNPYGVVALGFLSGWFSKTTTDKLQEVFETLFKTDQDKQRQDKLLAQRPIITGVEPAVVPQNEAELTVRGHNFLKGATVQLNGEELAAEFVSATELKVALTELPQRPAPGAERSLRVKNPEGAEPLSAEEPKVKFE
jgi:hypothetical protein